MTAEEIKELRTYHNCTQQKFAEMLGASSKATICNWETGVSQPERFFLEKLKKLQKKMNKH